MSEARASALVAAGTVGITGASGFVGRGLTERFARDGFRVVPFVRSPREPRSRPYRLGEAPDLDGIDALVHCAYAARAPRGVDVVELNVAGTVALYRAACQRGIRFAFLSSASAAGDAPSAYARQKRAIESAIAGDALILRPGLIVGCGGLFATVAAASRLPVVPLIDGGRQVVQVVALEDLYRALALALRGGVRGVHAVVAEPAMTMRGLISALAAARGRRATTVAVPYALAFAIASIAERAGLALPIGTENLRGLCGTRALEPSADLARLGWSPADAGAVLSARAENACAPCPG